MTAVPVLVAMERGVQAAAVRYATSTFLAPLETPYRFVEYEAGEPVEAPMLVLSYGWHPPIVRRTPHLHLAASSFFREGHYLRRVSLPGAPFLFEELPLVFGDAEEWSRAPGNAASETCFVGPDLFASAFFLLTGYEEVVQGGPLDRRGRYTAKQSWSGRHRLLDRPLVDEYGRRLEGWLRRLAPGLRWRRPHWHGRPFAVALTRDIDSLHRVRPTSLRACVRDVVRGRRSQMMEGLRLAWRTRRRGGQDPHQNLSAILAWERERGIRSSLYLMSSRAAGDANYDLREITRSVSVGEAAAAGWELGFHPGCLTPLCEETFLTEHAALIAESGPVAGGRQHGLRFRPPYTWRLWERAGLRYDTTVGFADREGFRCGTCRPFRPFDLIENRVLDLWELPLTVMDCTLDQYRGLGPEEARSVLHELLDTVHRHHGVFVLLWHNTYFGRENIGPYHDLLAEFIDGAIAMGGYVGAGVAVLDAWEAGLGQSGPTCVTGDDGASSRAERLASVGV